MPRAPRRGWPNRPGPASAARPVHGPRAARPRRRAGPTVKPRASAARRRPLPPGMRRRRPSTACGSEKHASRTGLSVFACRRRPAACYSDVNVRIRFRRVMPALQSKAARQAKPGNRAIGARRIGVDAGDDSYKWWALSCTSLGMLLATINSGTLIIALPDLERSLHTSLLELVWVILVYMIASTVLV